MTENYELYHFGILGMKWGIRRYQNPDGTLTEEGKKRYGNPKKVFVSGSSKTTTKDSGYYRKSLPKPIQKELNSHMRAGNKILVGDAPGVDRQVQDYLNSHKYRNVEVYGPGKNVRYSANPKWKTNPIDAPEYEEGSREWLAKKDIAMEQEADEGLAVILDEGSRATRANIERFLADNKDVRIYELSKNGSKYDSSMSPDVYNFLNYEVPTIGKFNGMSRAELMKAYNNSTKDHEHVTLRSLEARDFYSFVINEGLEDTSKGEQTKYYKQYMSYLDDVFGKTRRTYD